MNAIYLSSRLWRLTLRMIVIAVCVIASSGQTAEARRTNVNVSVYSAISRRGIKAQARAYDMADSSEIKVGTSISGKQHHTFTLEGGRKVMLEIYAVKAEGDEPEINQGVSYVNYVEDETYEPHRIELDLSENDEEEMTLEPVFLAKRRRKDLNEVTVTASRIMFYHKGDTLVYNASAFLLAEGSMLDALINQLPGVELRRNGVIYCNGKRVDQLLLNGRDMFNNNNELMLDNIAASTVKNIKVYEKTGDLSKMMGERMAKDTKYVMDVKLKKQYQIGWLGNMDAGYGTENRYLARLFGMWFNEYASITAYANANNLSDKRKPGSSDTSWSRSAMSGGVSTNRSAGMVYNLSGEVEKWEAKGSVDVTRTDVDNRNHSIRQNYLPGGDTWEYAWNKGQNRNTRVETNHYFRLRSIPGILLTVFPELKYSNYRNESGLTEASFTGEEAEITLEQVEAIYSGDNAALRRLINRRISSRLNRGHSLSGKVRIPVNIALKRTGTKSWLNVNLSGDYTKAEGHTFDRYRISIGATEPNAESAYQYNLLKPDIKKSAGGSVEYSCMVGTKKRNTLSVKYGINHSRQENGSGIYELDDNVDTGRELPDAEGMLKAFSPALSWNGITERTVHEAGVSFMPSMGILLPKKYGLFINVNNIGVESARSRYHYENNGRLQTIGHTRILPRLSANIYMTSIDKPTSLTMSFEASPRYADLRWMVDLPQTDPLNRYMGNPDLKDCTWYFGSLKFSHSRNQRRHVVTMTASTETDAMARGYVYDTETGVRTYRSYNVNGNWNSTAGYLYSMPFGKGNRFDMSTSTAGRFESNINMIGSTAADGGMPARSRVNTASVREVLKLNYLTGRHRLTARADLTVNRYFGNDAGFERFTSRTFNYGGEILLNLPWNWGISTDITLYTRRGFTDNRLNTTDLVWNARVTKSFLKGSIVVIADGYDLLRQLSSISYTVNAQARVQSVSNVIPAFVLLHVQYKFNKQPQKK